MIRNEIVLKKIIGSFINVLKRRERTAENEKTKLKMSMTICLKILLTKHFSFNQVND